ncbi:MAG: outer membrane beta-barrel protein [Myxococcota bacterium]
MKVPRLLAVLVVLLAFGLCGVPTRAWAGGAQNLPRVSDGEGVKVGKKSKFHGGIALPVGVDSNVFNEARSETPRSAAYLYPTAWLGVGSRDVVGGVLQTPPSRTSRLADYNIGLIAGFRQFLAADERIRSQPRLSVGTGLRFSILPGRRFEIRIADDFFRGANPGNYESEGTVFNFNRIEHDGKLDLIARPGGGRLSLSLGYHNLYLRFGNEANNKANRMRHGLAHETKWRFLPKSALVFNYTFDWTFYTDCCVSVGFGRNEDSFSHRLQGGFRGQVAKKLSVDALVGWGFGFYRDDPNGPNFSSFLGNFGLSYFPTLRTTLAINASRSFQDSLFGNYYVDNGVNVTANHQFRWRMNLNAGLGVIGRTYSGLSVPGEETGDITGYEGRGADTFQARDTLFTLQAKVDQPLGRIFSVGLSYTMLVDSTQFRVFYANGSEDELGYLKHMAWLVGAIRI